MRLRGGCTAGSRQARGRSSPILALSFLSAVGLVAAPASAKPPLPGLMSADEVHALQADAERQKEAAQAAVVHGARHLGYRADEVSRALEPTMIRKGTFDHELPDGTIIRFPWFRIGFAENDIANNEARRVDVSKGETNKGGVRVHKGVFESEVYALALKMDQKLGLLGDAVFGAAVRGAKGGIGAGQIIKVGSTYGAREGDYVDPASAAIDRPSLMERFAESFVASGGRVGHGADVQAGDVNTKAREMAALAARYESLGQPATGVSGKALHRRGGRVDPLGGVAYRQVSTGEGVWMSAKLAAEMQGGTVEGARVISQGWGEVGRAFGRAAVRDGALLIGIEQLWNVGGEEVPGLLMHPKGERATATDVKIWMAQVERLLAEGGDLRTFEGGRFMKHLVRGADTADVRADIVGINALGGTLNEETIPRYVRSGTVRGLKKILVEGANLAETREAPGLLDRAKDHLVAVPGDLANFGGVHVSNLEIVQNVLGRVVSDGEARASLWRSAKDAFRRASKLSTSGSDGGEAITLRRAVELVAIDGMLRRSLGRRNAPLRHLESRVSRHFPVRTPRQREPRGRRRSPLTVKRPGLHPRPARRFRRR